MTPIKNLEYLDDLVAFCEGDKKCYPNTKVQKLKFDFEQVASLIPKAFND